MAVKDIKHDSDGVDLVAVNGDFAAVDSDQQHIIDIVNSAQGHWKQFPLVGVGIDSFIGATSPDILQELERLIRLQLQSDGYGNITIDLSEFQSEEQININATRIQNP